MKNIYLCAIIAGLAGLGFTPASQAGDGIQLNVRQNIGNSSMNKISSARLQGIFSEKPKKTVESNKQFGRRGCVTSIASQQSGTSLMDRPRDVVINGDITNVCL